MRADSIELPNPRPVAFVADTSAIVRSILAPLNLIPPARAATLPHDFSVPSTEDLDQEALFSAAKSNSLLLSPSKLSEPLPALCVPYDSPHDKAKTLPGALQSHEGGDRSAERLPAVPCRARAEEEGEGRPSRARGGAPGPRQSGRRTRGEGLCFAGRGSGEVFPTPRTEISLGTVM